MRTTRILIPLLLFCLTACQPNRNGRADVLFFNAKVWTGVADSLPADAVAIAGDTIVGVGNRDDLGSLLGPNTREIDLGGRFLMPGFMDNHTHFVDGGFILLGLDLRSARDEQDFAARIARKAAELKPGEWILGGDWDHQSWPSKEVPTRALIDAGTPETPVFVNRMDGHMALANTAALRLAGVTRTTKDPPGGHIVRDENGEPTGLLKDAAMNLVNAVIPPPDEEQIRRAALTALQEAARLGVTSVSAMVSFRDFKVLQRLSSEGLLTSRIYAITPLPEFEKWRDVGVERGFGDSFLKVGAVKGFVDGSLGSTTAWFYEPFDDAPETSGLPSDMWFPEGNLSRLITQADAAGLQLVIHAIGDRANDELLNIFAGLPELNGRKDRRARIEHAQHLTREAISRFRELGVIASMQPYHAIDDGRWAERRIGSERIKTTYAFRSLLDAGAVLTFGSDWTVAPLNPLLGVYAAVTRRTFDDQNPDGWVPEEKISVNEALTCYTVNNAYAVFEENRLGSLEVGKWADLVVLSQSPFEVSPEQIGDLQVQMTIVGGRTVFNRD